MILQATRSSHGMMVRMLVHDIVGKKKRATLFSTITVVFLDRLFIFILNKHSTKEII